MPMPALPHAALPRAAVRVRVPLADLALTEPGEWPVGRAAVAPRDPSPTERAHPGLAVGAALMAIALMITALDPSLRTGASEGASCGHTLHTDPSGPVARRPGPPRHGPRSLTP